MPQFKFSGEAVPSSVDIRVSFFSHVCSCAGPPEMVTGIGFLLLLQISNKGSVVMRMSFPRSDWDEAAEAETLTFCNWLGDRLTECC